VAYSKLEKAHNGDMCIRPSVRTFHLINYSTDFD